MTAHCSSGKAPYEITFCPLPGLQIIPKKNSVKIHYRIRKSFGEKSMSDPKHPIWNEVIQTWLSPKTCNWLSIKTINKMLKNDNDDWRHPSTSCFNLINVHKQKGYLTSEVRCYTLYSMYVYKSTYVYIILHIHSCMSLN